MASPDSIAAAGRAGRGAMLIPLTFGVMRELIGVYRDAWKSAGHPGNGRIMMAYHMLCWPDRGEADAIAKPLIEEFYRNRPGTILPDEVPVELSD